MSHRSIEQFVSHSNTLGKSVAKLMHDAYSMRRNTPADLLPHDEPWIALHVDHYPGMTLHLRGRCSVKPDLYQSSSTIRNLSSISKSKNENGFAWRRRRSRARNTLLKSCR